MVKEDVDIVDENDNIVGKTSKKEAHQKGLLHRTVIAEVINPRDEWLLVKQANHKQDAGQFVSPVGGHISSGETNEEALKREAIEEIGIKDFKYTYKGKIIYSRIVKETLENHLFVIYEVHYDGKVTLNDESVESRWFTEEEIKKILNTNMEFFGDAFYPVIKNFYSYLFNV